MNALTSLNPQDLDQLARKRAGCLALLIHAAVVFIIPQEGGRHARLVQRERNLLQAMRYPW